MARSLNILQISPQFPFPEDEGGKIALGGMFKSLNQTGNNTTLAAYSLNQPSDELMEYASSIGDVRLIRHNTQNTKMRIVNSIFRSEAISFSRYYSDSVLQQLESIIESDSFDIIQCEHSYLSKIGLLLRKKYKIPLALRLHNLEWLIWKRYADTFSEYDPRRLYLERQSELVKQDEKIGIENADICFSISDIDKARAKELAPRSKVTTIFPGVDLNKFKPVNGINRDPYTMVIATTYNWVHNTEGVKWFLENVLPIIKNRIPQAKLNIIGKNPPEYFSKYKHLGVNVLGYVDEVQSKLSEAEVYIAPLFVGSGIRIKILEALAMELPVVATKVSAEGIKDNYSNGLYVTDIAEEFAQAIIDLLLNPETARNIGKTAREYIHTNFTWEKSAELMIKEFRKITKKH